MLRTYICDVPLLGTRRQLEISRPDRDGVIGERISETGLPRAEGEGSRDYTRIETETSHCLSIAHHGGRSAGMRFLSSGNSVR